MYPGAAFPTIQWSLHCAQLGFSVMVSFAERETSLIRTESLPCDSLKYKHTQTCSYSSHQNKTLLGLYFPRQTSLHLSPFLSKKLTERAACTCSRIHSSRWVGFLWRYSHEDCASVVPLKPLTKLNCDVPAANLNAQVPFSIFLAPTRHICFFFHSENVNSGTRCQFPADPLNWLYLISPASYARLVFSFPTCKCVLFVISLRSPQPQPQPRSLGIFFFNSFSR